MRAKAVLFCAPFILLSLLFGCEKINFLNPQKASPPKGQTTALAVKGTVIAKVNNLPISLEELNRYIDIYNASLDLRQDLTAEQKKAAKIDSREKKIDYLKNILVRQAVFYQAALDRGLDKREDFMEILERYKIYMLAQEMQNETIKNLEVSSADVEMAYENNKNLFREPESRKVREIVTKTEEEAKQILVELLQGADFITLAKTRSIADSAQNGGDLGSVKKGQKGAQYANFDEVAFSAALAEGAVSSVFKGPKGYYILKIEEIKAGKQVSLSEAWDTLKALLLARKQQEELDKTYSQLSRDAKIEIYEGEIK